MSRKAPFATRKSSASERASPQPYTLEINHDDNLIESAEEAMAGFLPTQHLIPRLLAKDVSEEQVSIGT